MTLTQTDTKANTETITDKDDRFDALGLSPALVKAVTELGYKTPSPIQAQAIPAVLAGKDVMAAAQTGTGKTAGFTLPLLDLLSKGKKASGNQVRALILTPTRELAAQVQDSVEQYSKHLPLTSTVVFGGVKINPQMMRLRKGADVLVATPGRLLDLHNQNAVKFDELEILILDEADRMLDMGFIHDIKRVLRVLPAQRQNLLFSATFSDEIRDLAKGLVNDPVEISVAPRNTTAKSVTQWLCPVDKPRKRELLMHLISSNRWEQVLVFTRTKHGANKLTKYLEQYGIAAAAIHGNKSQGARTRALAAFKANEINVLVATDIAARGIDIDQLPYVVNFELPQVAEDYVHRIGRTGRASATGQAVSLVCQEEYKQLVAIERLTQQLIERKVIPDFVPTQDLKETADTRPPKAKRPKKPKQRDQNGGQNRANKPQATNGNDRRESGDNRKPRRNHSDNRHRSDRSRDNNRSEFRSDRGSTYGKQHAHKNRQFNDNNRNSQEQGNERNGERRGNRQGNRRNQRGANHNQQGDNKHNQNNHRNHGNAGNGSNRDKNRNPNNRNASGRNNQKNTNWQSRSNDNQNSRSNHAGQNGSGGYYDKKNSNKNYQGKPYGKSGNQHHKKKRRYPLDENGDVNGNVK